MYTFKNTSTSQVSMQNTKQDTTIILHTRGMYKYETIFNNYLCSKDNANKLCALKLDNLVQNIRGIFEK